MSDELVFWKAETERLTARVTELQSVLDQNYERLKEEKRAGYERLQQERDRGLYREKVVESLLKLLAKGEGLKPPAPLFVSKEEYSRMSAFCQNHAAEGKL